MSEQQYAFAIGFDADATEMTPQQQADWQEMVQHIAQAIAAANLPALFSERWDEFGQGRVFWGTQADCEAVRQIISQFPVVLQEERNLEEGYYAMGGQRYYVNALGEIYGLPGDGVFETPPSPQRLSSIPLDAYRLHNLSPEITQSVETILRAESVAESEVAQEIAERPAETATVDAVNPVASSPNPLSTGETSSEVSQSTPDPVVSAFIEDLQSEISTLKEQVAALSNDLAKSRAIAAVKIEPAIFETLQQEYAGKQEQFEQLQQRYQDKQAQSTQLEEQVQSLSAQVAALQSAVPDTTHLQELETLRTQLHQQQQTHTELQAQFQVQTEEGEALRTKIRTLETELLQHQEERATSSRLVQERNDTLVQDALTQSTQIVDLERNVRQLQGEVQQWKAMAEERVDFVEYQRVQQELTRLRGRLRQGIRGRLLGWLFL